jgi:hypothetical protein
MESRIPFCGTRLQGMLALWSKGSMAVGVPQLAIGRPLIREKSVAIFVRLNPTTISLNSGRERLKTRRGHIPRLYLVDFN